MLREKHTVYRTKTMMLQYCCNYAAMLPIERSSWHLPAMLPKVAATLPSTWVCIPKTGPSRKSRTPGWNDFVEGSRREALYWHHRWAVLGRPASGPEYNHMKRSRKEYQYSVRWCKRNTDVLSSQKMAESLINEKREFWNEVKRTNRSSKTIPSNIDGIRDAEGN